MFTLPELQYTSLGDLMSEETLSFHHKKHHAGYIAKLNAALENSELADKTLEEIIKTSNQNNNLAIFNNAAQHFNHSFFWTCFSETKSEIPESLTTKLTEDFGSLESFKETFSKAAASLFGSGWVWLTQDESGKLEILDMSNAGTPVTENKTPLLTIDVWEHAYYIDHRNARATYIEKFWDFVNWEAVSERLR